MYSEHQLRLIIDAIATLAWSARADGTPEFFNQRWLDYTGLSAEQALGSGWKLAIQPDDLPRMLEIFEQAVNARQSFEAEGRLRRCDGEFRWFLFRGSPLRDESGKVVKWYGTNTDIEDQKRVEDVLRADVKSFRQIIDSIPGVIVILTAEGQVELVNREGLEYFGKTLEELKSWSVQDVVHPDDVPAAVTAWRRAVETGDPYNSDHRNRRADGVYRWFHSRALPLRDTNGRIVRWLNLNTDIDERKKAEENLQRSEAFLAQGQSISHTGSFGWNVLSGEIYWSEETYNIFEHDRSAKPTLEFVLSRIHPDDRELVQQTLERATNEGTDFDLQHRLLMPDGSVKHILVLTRASKNSSGNLEFVGAVTDVTAAKQAEETLRESEAYLAEAQRLGHTGSWAWTPATGEMRYWSKECYRLLGLDPHGEQPRFETSFQRIHPDDQPRTAEKFERAKREVAEFELSYRIVHPGGEIRDIHVVGHPVLSPSGDLVEFVGSVIDVTEHQRLERELQHERDRLRLLLDLNNRVASHLDLRQLFQAISSELRRVFQCDFVGLVRPENEGKQLRQYMIDFPESKGFFKEGALLPMEGSSAGVAFRSAKPVVLNSVSEERARSSSAVVQAFYKRVTDEGLQSGCFLPLVSGDRKMGVLQLVSRRERCFAEQDVAFLDQVAKQIAITLKNALEYEQVTETKDRLHDENVALREEIDRASMFEEIVGISPALHAVLSRVSKVAPTDSTVLITGETGTGKELIARAVHKRSQRSSRAFVSVNCAPIPRDLIASELFGHEKGAFTGATQRRLGRFELAEGGTIFLDEIGELPAETQIALLRVLQEHEFERVGGTGSIRTNVRVIAATNRDLQTAIAGSTFRSDLFYRLNVFPIEVPPLRERREDIPVLVEYFIDRYARKAGKSIRGVNKKSLELLQSYPWPGNIRELQNVIERSVIVCDTENFSVDESWLSRQPLAAGPKSQPELPRKLAAQEKEMIEDALCESGGRVSGPSGAAAKLGIPGSTLETKIRSLKINKNRFKTEGPPSGRI
jgi:formate hydrogenlyase transcriptional activator